MKKKLSIILFSLLLLLSSAGSVLAAVTVSKPEDLALPDIEVEDVLKNILSLIAKSVATIAVLVIVVGGILWMTAGGDEEQVVKARKMIIAAVVGLIIVAAAVGIVNFTLEVFNK